jgi:serine/threonine protein phosphatase PrpC
VSRKGPHRTNNEDAYFAGSNGLFIVADGMGGHRFGEVASWIAVDTIAHELVSHFGSLRKNPRVTMVGAVRRANEEIIRRINADPRLRGMGTTVIVGYVDDGTFHTANVGDSRGYLIALPDRIVRLTEDHTIAQQLVNSGVRDSVRANKSSMRRLLTRSLGEGGQAQADYNETRISHGDYLLLCTDGLSNAMFETEMIAEVRKGASLKQICRSLTVRAYDLGGTDNITVIVGKATASR